MRFGSLRDVSGSPRGWFKDLQGRFKGLRRFQESSSGSQLNIREFQKAPGGLSGIQRI